MAPARIRGFTGALTPMVGRDEELLVACGQILDPLARMLTLVGPGGVGKSRLAAAAAEQVRGRFDNGGAVVDLSDAADPYPVLGAIATALDLPAPEPGRTAATAAAIGDRELLLVLDNCDHIVEQLPDLLHELLTTAQRLRILATCRQPLHVYGERLLRVAPLATPGSAADFDLMELTEVPSVALFVQRVRAVDPGFALTVDNAPSIAEICNRLDGLPLAIELLAGRMRVFRPHALLTRLRRGEDVLIGGHVTAPARHRSIEALIAWSYDRLDADLRDALNRLSLCADGFGLCATAELLGIPAAAAERALESLVDRNLIIVRERHDGEPCFAMLSTIRDFGLAQLAASGQLADARHRSARRAQRLARGAAPLLSGSEQASKLQQLALEHKNLDATLSYLADRNDGRELAQMALDLHRFWLISGRLQYGANWLDTAAAVCAGSAPELAARSADAAGTLLTARGDAKHAVARHERALAGFRAIGDPVGEGLSLVRLGAALCRADDPARGLVRLGEGLEAVRGRDEPAEAAALVALADAAAETDDLPRVEELAGRALKIYRGLGDDYGAALALRRLAAVAQVGGANQEADRMHRHSLTDLQALGSRPELARGLADYGRFMLRVVAGQEQRVARMLAVSEVLHQAAGVTLAGHEAALHEITTQDLRTRLGTVRFDSARLDGRRLDPAAAVVDALSCPPVDQAGDAEVCRARSLTPRQFQVAILVGQGLTNRQVAHRLELSEWTVVNHVRQIMRKLGCASRVHVAQWVAQQKP
jgi:predicted ATPase/DNA-binding CsgD family transcriptional regulator